jgi:hypothetical protein
MLNKILGNMISGAGENVDNTTRKITCFKDLELITPIEFVILFIFLPDKDPKPAEDTSHLEQQPQSLTWQWLLPSERQS